MLLSNLFNRDYIESGKHLVTTSKRYVVLDIDSTLVFTMDDKMLNALEKSVSKSNYDLSKIIYKIPDPVDEMFAFGLKRPHIELFLQFCFWYFDGVCIWTAGTAMYAKKIVAELFKDLPSPMAVFTRNDCALDSTNTYYKPLSSMYKKYPQMNASNTIIIDDNPTTIKDNPNNAILIPAYAVTTSLASIQKEDVALLVIMWNLLTQEYLECEDYRTLKHDFFVDKNL